jgi:hypothetical protein
VIRRVLCVLFHENCDWQFIGNLISAGGNTSDVGAVGQYLIGLYECARCQRLSLGAWR